MRKIFVFVMTLMMVISCGTANKAQSTNVNKTQTAINKTNSKQAKKIAKLMKKEGWETISKTQNLNDLLYKHISTLENGTDNVEFVGFAKSRSKSAARNVSTFDAAIDYANQSLDLLRGKMASDLNYAEADATEFNKLYVAYTTNLTKKINGELKRSFTIVRNVNGIYEVESYYILNEDAASKARVQAMKRAIEETKIAQEYAQQVIDFVENNADPAIGED